MWKLVKIENKVESDISTERKKIEIFFSRLKNPKVIGGLTSLILITLLNLHAINQLVSNSINQLVEAILSILAALGIFSNPDSHLTKESKPKDSDEQKKESLK